MEYNVSKKFFLINFNTLTKEHKYYCYIHDFVLTEAFFKYFLFIDRFLYKKFFRIPFFQAYKKFL